MSNELRKGPESKCAGSSNLFVIQVGNKGRNLPLQRHIIRKRILVPELNIDSCERLLLENTNMSNVRGRDTLSYLAALSLDCGERWHLCVVVKQNMTTMVVVMAFIQDNNEVKVFGKPCLHSIHEPSVKAIYLNLYNASQSFHDSDGNLKCIKLGPDIVPNLYKLSSVKRFMKKYKGCFAGSLLSPSVSVEVDVDDQSLLFTLQKNPKNKMKVMNNKGATLVVIEGTMSCLSQFENLCHESQSTNEIAIKMKPFLIPFASDAVAGKDCNKFEQRFHLKRDPNPLKHVPGHSDHIQSFDSICTSDKEFQSAIETICYDVSRYDKGLIFAFKCNEDIKKPRIVRECILQTSMQPNDVFKKFKAVVLSEWFNHPNFFHANQEAINLVHNVHGQTGFGSRCSTSSVGTNVYSGKRQTLATVGSPLLPLEDLYESKLHTLKINTTFLPAVEKMFNKYSKQATDVMLCANRLLDRFTFMVMRTFENDEKHCETLSKNRFCRLSIWTSGNSRDLVDGFTNNVHRDRDCFHKKFQEVATCFLSKLELSKVSDEADIEYLKEMINTADGNFQSPTVCGYDIVHKEYSESGNEEDKWQVHAFFALLGLGISVKLGHCYHSFLASSVSHCTPTPISIAHDIVCTYTGGDVTIVGWGGGNNVERRTFYIDHGGPAIPRLTQALFERWLENVPANIRELARRNALVP